MREGVFGRADFEMPGPGLQALVPAVDSIPGPQRLRGIEPARQRALVRDVLRNGIGGLGVAWNSWQLAG
jgi:hypothetical protein